MKVLIDGHNALAALRIRASSHEAQRRALLRHVATVAPQATVFFDAREAPPDAGPVGSELGIRVRYCREQEADAFILEEVRDAPAPGRVLVVTNDRELAGRARHLGAQASSVQEFFGSGPAPPERPRRRKPPSVHPRFTPQDFGLPDEVDLEDPDLD